MTDTRETAEALWDARYAERPQLWSGRVNAVVREIVEPLEPATALDVGCGEGGDVIWLAKRGWKATGIDVSGVAIERASRAAAEHGVADVARFERRDLDLDPDVSGEWALVVSSYLHSPGPLNRRAIFRAASGAVARGGLFLVVGHAAPPPWADARQHEHAPRLPGVDETLDEMALDSAHWNVDLAEERAREVLGPDGAPAELLDVVVLARRR